MISRNLPRGQKLHIQSSFPERKSEKAHRGPRISPSNPVLSKSALPGLDNLPLSSGQLKIDGRQRHSIHQISLSIFPPPISIHDLSRPQQKFRRSLTSTAPLYLGGPRRRHSLSWLSSLDPSPLISSLRPLSPLSPLSPRTPLIPSSSVRSRAPLTMVSSNVGIALVLTCVGSLSTALGGLLVVLQKVPDIKRLGLLQGFAAGLMLSLSFFDLVPNAIQAIGFAAANVWFFAGCLLFAGVVAFIPEPSLLPDSASDTNLSSQGSTKLLSSSSEKDKSKDASVNGKPPSMAESDNEKESNWRRRKAVLYSGIITAIGISMHNFPEGIAVFLGSMKGLSVGISLAVAIALHNIPEGLAVALPMYYATRNRWTAFKAAALSGLAEPLAVIVVGLLFPNNLAPELIEGMLAGVGGIMAFLTLHEMLPLAFEYAGHRTAVTSAFVGMAVMSANLQLLAWAVPEDVAL